MLIALLWAVAAADLLVLGIRIAHVLSAGDVSETGIEGPGLYAMWKARHGHAIYEWPTRPFFALSLYNVAFYKIYAWMFALMDARDAVTPLVGRFITLAFALLGAGAQVVILTKACSRPIGRSSGALVVPLAVISWLGAALPGWWTLSIRPDVAGVALATIGMGFAMRCVAGGGSQHLWLASVFFLFAWLFKQSTVALFAGCLLFFALRPGCVRNVLALLTPFACGVVLTVWWGGEVYRFNTLEAPRLNQLAAWDAFYWYRGLFLPRLLLWAGCVAAAVVLYREQPRDRDSALGLVFTAAACSLALGAVLLAKAGSATNHVLELNVAAGMLSTLVLARAVSGDIQRTSRVVVATAICIVPMVGHAAGMLHDDRGLVPRALALHTQPSRLLLHSREETHRRRTLAETMSRLRSPIYIHDDLFALPWFANHNQYPAVVLDAVFFDSALAKGMVGDGLAGLLRRHHFATLILRPDSYLRSVALDSGYKPAGTVDAGGGARLEIFQLE